MGEFEIPRVARQNSRILPDRYPIARGRDACPQGAASAPLQISRARQNSRNSNLTDIRSCARARSMSPRRRKLAPCTLVLQTAEAPRRSTDDASAALVLEFQRTVARLVRAGVVSRATATRIQRAVQRDRTEAVAGRRALEEAVLGVLHAIEDGALDEGTHYVRTEAGCLALHLASIASATMRGADATRGSRDLRRAFGFGRRLFGDVVVAHSARWTFRAGDRRRATLLDVEQAYAFIGSRPPPVPTR